MCHVCVSFFLVEFNSFLAVEELSRVLEDKNSFLRAKKAVIWQREGVVSKISSFSLCYFPIHSFIHSIIDLSFIPHLFIYSMRNSRYVEGKLK